MSDIMRPIPFESMLNWIIDEFLQNQTIFSYPEQKFFIKKTQSSTQLFGENLETPLGPAAGPHTQMAQNIIVAYLSGGRFFELKTVQKLDKLNIPRPCIEAQDEGYNVEWSQELLLEQSFDEYLKAWFILHLLQAIFTGKLPDQRQFIFNMSVGYDLAGIKTPRMDKFINNLIDASQHASFSKYKTLLLTYLKKNSIQQKLRQMHKSTGMDEIIEAVNNIPPDISTSVTVSTMHGCPPDEIEAICNYLLKEKHMHTYVKLNPTLLGFERVNRMLQDLGYRYVQLDQAAFEHDLQYADAVPMLRRLQETAAKEERVFGVKLSNTLGMKNSLKHLPGDEMYMSGRALFPLTISLAAKLAAEFGGQINISYSGGASAHNVLAILKTGIAPVTMVTDLLKPGGYARLQQMAERVDAQPWPDWLQQNIDVNALQNLAESCLNDPYYQKGDVEAHRCFSHRGILHIDYGEFDLTDWTAGDLGDEQTLESNIGAISRTPDIGFKNLDVTDALWDDIVHGRQFSQYRVRFRANYDDDWYGDYLSFYALTAPASDGDPKLILEWQSVNSVSEETEIIQAESHVVSVYPNPFNSSLNLHWNFGSASETVISIYDLRGNLINKTSQDEVFGPNYSHFKWDMATSGLSNLSSGIFIIQVQSEGMIESVKALYLK